MARFLRRPPSIAAVATTAIIAFTIPWLWGYTAPVLAPYIYPYISPYLPPALQPSSYGGSVGSSSGNIKNNAASSPAAYECRQTQGYATNLISLNPLVIYIENFLRPSETTELLEAGKQASSSSSSSSISGFLEDLNLNLPFIAGTPDSSAGLLPRDNPTVQCVLERASQFLGSTLDPERDDVGAPRVLRYKTGKGKTVDKGTGKGPAQGGEEWHYDWYETPQPRKKGDTRGIGNTWNRIATLHAFLEEDSCEGGELWFPFISPTHSRRVDTEHLWKPWDEAEHGQRLQSGKGAEGKGGLVFRPVAGNALFWVNLHANGTGDERVAHAGLPITSGSKTIMDIWPRKYYD